VAVADVNGDGRPDLITANYGTHGSPANSVSVLLGNGNGTFHSAVNFAAGSYPVSVAVADVNGDGRPDLVVANETTTVSVLLGNGNGTFQSPVSYTVGLSPTSVAVADVNGDGHPDLVTANSGSSYSPRVGKTVSVLLGNGNGTFQAAQNFTTDSRPSSVVVADVNGDGRPDLVTTNYGANAYGGNDVSVLLGNGNGTFHSAANYPVAPGPQGLAVADVNGDGHLDLVTADYGIRSVIVLLGNGNGTFQAATNYLVGAAGPGVAAADVNGDGVPDLMATNAPLGGSGTVSLLLGIRNAATHFTVKAPVSVTAGTSFTITVTALTAGNQLDAVYTGTVHFTSSDGSAVLPTDYTFTLKDAGSHTFKVTLNSTGSQTITATDTHTSSIKGQATVTVNAAAPPPAPSRGSGGGQSVGVDAAVAATLLSIPATLPAAYSFVDPDAASHSVPAVLTPAGSPTIAATEPGRQTEGMTTQAVHAAIWTAQGGQPVDPEGALLNPAAIEAFFAHNGFTGSGKNI
jgi:hypothetical protein